jgi:protein-glutamine gamma-glutamyltransferase
MEMRRSANTASLQAKSEDQELTYRKMAVSLAGISPALVATIFLGAAVIFFLLPRISSGYLSAYAPGGDIATGFSDVVQLGRIGQIQQSTTLVMHIQIDDDTRGAYDLKWRGVSLDLFDGKTWSNPHEQRFLPRSSEGRFILPPPTGRTFPISRQTARPIHYRVLMEPVSSNVFFLAPAAVTLEGNYRMIAADASGSVFDLDPEHPISRYEATSDLAQASPAALRSASDIYPPRILVEDLQLPPMDPRVARLASEITGSAIANYDRAVAVNNYLRTHFAYTLQLPRTPPQDPVANFLFERKQGHCEYFAASMAVMLRSLRIPSRVVNGFRTGEFNDLTSQYLIRASNAHAWVEVYFPGYGWVSFDPTPAAIEATPTGWGRAMLYVDAMASFWRDWVVSYDLNHQSTLGRQVVRSSFEWYEHMRRWARRHYDALLEAARHTQQNVTDSPGRWSIAGGMVVLILLIAANLGRLYRAFRRSRIAAQPDRSPRTAATIWYQRMIHTLAKRGLRRSPAQTPKEFADSLTGLPVQKGIAKFTEHYERARFGDSAEDARRLPELYAEVSTASRH